MSDKIKSLLVSFTYFLIFTFLFNIYTSCVNGCNINFSYNIIEEIIMSFFYSLLLCASFPPMLIFFLVYGSIFLVVLISDMKFLENFRTTALSILMISWYLVNYYIVDFLAKNY